MKSSIGQNARFVNETLTQLARLLIPHMVFAIPFKISNIHWPVCGYSQYISTQRHIDNLATSIYGLLKISDWNLS
jgi:hypothetical protein